MTPRAPAFYASPMNDYRYIPIKGGDMKTYIFHFRLVQEEDGRWSAEVPALPGCATCGDSKEEAIQNIHDAAEAYIRDMQKVGDRIPKNATIQVIDRPVVVNPVNHGAELVNYLSQDLLPLWNELEINIELEMDTLLHRLAPLKLLSLLRKVDNHGL